MLFYIMNLLQKMKSKFILTGTISMYGSITAPDGYSLCDGGELNRITDAALFAIIALKFYPITAERAHETRRMLEERRGNVAV